MLAYGQTPECTQTLAQANEEFNQGRFFGIASILQECLEDGFTIEQQVQAYHLLTQAYLILDDPIAAENSYLKLLQADPEYIANTDNDPVDIVYLSKKFTATPIFTPNYRFGTNVSAPRLIHANGTEGYATSRSNSLRPNLHFGAGMDWNYNDNLSIGAEATLSFKSFKTTINGISIDDTQEAIERYTWIDVPLFIKYRDNFGNIRPFGYAGYSLNLMLSASAELRTDNRSPIISAGERQQGSEVPTEGPDVNIGYKRNFLNRSMVLGGGIYYKVGHDFIIVDVRYVAGLSNVTKESELYYDKDGNFAPEVVKYRWTGDLFRFDNISLSFGYVKPLYNPRKIKRARTKKVLRELSKEEN